MKQLILDFGNSALKAGCFAKSELLKAGRAEWSNDLLVEELLLKMVSLKPERAFIGSVKGKQKATESFLKRAEIPFTYIQQGGKLPIKIAYETPATLGLDRLANAVMANEIFAKKPVVVIDAGTCIKFDFITKMGEYFGGSIAPGINMRFKALHEFTEKLPLVERSETVFLVGKNTLESIQSGVLNGAFAEVKGILEQYQMTHKDLQVVLTGGDSTLFDQHLKTSLHCDPWFTLKGLNEIIRYQKA